MSDDGDDDTPRDDEHTVASTDSTADAPAPFLDAERRVFNLDHHAA